MKNTLICLSIIILSLTLIKNKNQNEVIIPTDSIRFRVIASSDSELDIETKLELKDHIEKVLIDLTKNATTTEEVDKIIVDNLEFINIQIHEFLKNDNYKLDYGLNYFPSKTYKGVVYEAGVYDSLVITIGNGLGKNWWCTLFPPLCLLENNETTNDVEYKLFISSIILCIFLLTSVFLHGIIGEQSRNGPVAQLVRAHP